MFLINLFHQFYSPYFVIPAQAGIQFARFQLFLINSCSIGFPDSRLRGNDGGKGFVVSDNTVAFKF
ncbi:hypothetical protein COH84_08000 [Neisseria meningitidis]|nr:hypothetical protein COH84_08000 [Neisseria meningitidis]